MVFYHYTSAALVDGILRSGLTKGHMNTPTEIIQPVVWLTTDSKGEGHGLTTGGTLKDSEMSSLEKIDGVRPKNRKTHDKLKVRLTFDIPENEMYKLVPFTDYCDRIPNGKMFAKLTGLSCYMDVSKFSATRLKTEMKKTATKEKTWWISFLPVPAKFITTVDLRDEKGSYQPYDFEKLDRPAMEELGFYFPSAEATSELQTIVKPLHPCGYTKGAVICPKPGVEPFVCIRGGPIDLLYEIKTGKPVIAKSEFDVVLASWVEKYKAQLEDAWVKAEQSYYSYYPEQRK